MGIYKRRFRTGVLQVGKSIIGINTGSSSGGNVVVLGEENNRRAVQEAVSIGADDIVANRVGKLGIYSMVLLIDFDVFYFKKCMVV